MKTSIRRLLAALLLISMLGMAVPAMAANQYMYATTNVNMRYGPGTSYGVITWLEQGTRVAVTGSSGNWYEVYYMGQTGYVSKTYLSTGVYYVDDTVPNTGTRMYTTTALNVRAGAGTKYKLIGALKKGAAVDVISKSGNWSKITYKDGTAYVSSKYLTSNVYTGSPYFRAGYMTATTQVNVRSGAGTKYTVLGWLDKGERVYVTGQNGDWYCVNYNGLAGYVHGSALSGNLYYGNYCGSCGGVCTGWCYNGGNYWYGSDQSFTRSSGYGFAKGGFAYYTTNTGTRPAVYLEEDTVVYYTGYNSNWVRLSSGGDVLYTPASNVTYIT